MGSISKRCKSDVCKNFKRIYIADRNHKRTFVITVASVKHAINISETILEQYKLLMRAPDKNLRNIYSNDNNDNCTKIDRMERTMINRKLERSKSKFNEHMRGILLFKSELLKVGAVVAFKDGVISSTKKAVVYTKWLPNTNDAIECQKFERMLATFNDEKICSRAIIESTITVTLLPHKAIPRPAIMNYLNDDRYARLNLNLNGNIVELEINNYELFLY
ncbi:unnamed protein product [Adineta steineri]|uniref:Uncharacterized protein n=1 Tax=Adineta steineri TaxID=433720 RepID=A0A819LSP4_9BILA|nr:unnamed protein product [Adineta steineri]CAF3965903.1 unnamed protein product [Adineta steineri]